MEVTLCVHRTAGQLLYDISIHKLQSPHLSLSILHCGATALRPASMYAKHLTHTHNGVQPNTPPIGRDVYKIIIFIFTLPHTHKHIDAAVAAVANVMDSGLSRSIGHVVANKSHTAQPHTHTIRWKTRRTGRGIDTFVVAREQLLENMRIKFSLNLLVKFDVSTPRAHPYSKTRREKRNKTSSTKRARDCRAHSPEPS